MKRVLVAGAGGYLGMVLCPQLVGAGYHVVALDRYFFGKKPEACDIIVGDTRDVGFEGLSGYDAVVDLAGLSNDAACEIDPYFTQSINRDGGRSLASAAKEGGVARYVYASSASVYGHGEKMGLTELSDLHPQTAYAKSKVEVEDHLRKISDGLFKPVILRNATLFGVSPRMRFDLAVNIMTLRAKETGRIYVMGGGKQWRPFLHVRDAASAIMWALETKGIEGQTYNVGSNSEQFTIEHLADMVKTYFAKVEILRIPDGPDNRSYHLSFDKFQAAYPKRNIVGVHYGIMEIMKGLTDGTLKGDDPTCYTVQWYSSMLEWNKRLEDLKAGGPIL